MKAQKTLLALFTACCIGVATAGNVTGLTTFTSGSKAVASQVNGNFSAVKTAVDSNNTEIVALKAIITDLTTRLAAIEANSALTLDKKVSYSMNNGVPEVRFYGVNVKITNGAGQTDSINGVGNLIVGYDLDSGSNNKTGSHNLVVGDMHTYSSYGGLVVGHQNTVSAPAASVSGGNRNKASGIYSSVTGGYFNIASGTEASVTGGYQNLASGLESSVTGGSSNYATAQGSSVSGGVANGASGVWSSVSGGQENTATAGGIAASVSGGQNRTAATPNGWVAGGLSQAN